MQKLIFLGTDLHGEPTELAAKLVKTLCTHFLDSCILSLQYRKPNVHQKNCTIVPQGFSNIHLKRLFQGILLPFYLLFMRRHFSKIISFWTTRSKYHEFLFCFMKLLRYHVVYTAIAQREQLNFQVLNLCDEIVVQSREVYNCITKKLPKKNVTLIYPGVDLNIFIPLKKKYSIIIPSVPYDVKDFDSRGINVVLEEIEKNKLSAVIIFRSQAAYENIKKRNLKNVKLINKTLSDPDLAGFIGQCRIMPLFYSETPELPLSAVEGLACGCAVVCSSNIGIGNMIEENNAGFVVKDKIELEKNIKILMKEDLSNDARKIAEKYFDKKYMIGDYKRLLN